VFTTGSDPVKDGLVTNLNRPTSNVTGVVFLSDNLGSKRLGLLRTLVPKAATVGVLVNPSNPGTRAEQRDLEDAAHVIGQQLIILNVLAAGLHPMAQPGRRHGYEKWQP